MKISSETNYRKIVCCILAAALVLRVGWSFLISVVPIADGNAYNNFARILLEYGVYGPSPSQLSAFWPPGTSAVYAVLYSMFGYNFTPIVVFNIVCSTAIVGLTIWLGQVFFGSVVALTAGVLMAIWPSEIAYVTILASELPFTFLVLLGISVWFAVRWSRITRGILSGLFFGAATYFRPVAMLLPIVLLLTELSNWRKLRDQFPTALLAMVVILVLVAPWSMRNTKLFGHVVLFTSSDGVNLWMGNNPDATGFYMAPPADTAALSEYDQNKVLGERAKQYIAADPVAFVMRTLKKAVLLHVGETIAAYWNAEGIERRFGGRGLFLSKIVMQTFWSGVLLLALAGIIVMVRQRGIVLALTNPVVFIWAYFTVVYAIILIADRFHFPSHPLISMLAASTILASVTSFNRRARLNISE